MSVRRRRGQLAAVVQIEDHGHACENHQECAGEQDASQQNRDLLALRIGRPGDAESLDEHLDQILKKPQRNLSFP